MKEKESKSHNFFNHARLKIAREYAGFTQTFLSKEMNCTQAAISRFEEGDLVPSETQILKMADILDWPPEFFYLPAEVIALPATTHFRKQSSMPASIVAKVHAQVNLTIALLRLAGYKSNKTYNLAPVMLAKLQPEDAARAILDLWGIDPSVPFELVKKIESSGVLIVEMDLGGVDAGEIDGLSILTHDLGAIIFINKKSDADRLRFTLAHELGHILMHHLEPRLDMEREANTFAGNLILPEEMLNRALSETPLSLAALPIFKKKFKTSMAAILFRIHQLGRMSDHAYASAWREFNRLGWKKKEPYSIEREAPSCFSSFLADIPSVSQLTGMPQKRVEEIYGIAA